MKYFGFIKVYSTHEVLLHHQSISRTWSFQFTLKLRWSMKFMRSIEVSEDYEVYKFH